MFTGQGYPVEKGEGELLRSFCLLRNPFFALFYCIFRAGELLSFETCPLRSLTL